MDKVYINSDIFYVENFLSDEIHNFLMDICLNADWEYEDPYVPNRGSIQIDQEIYDPIWKEYEEKIYSLFNKSMHISNHTRTVQNFKDGGINRHGNYVLGLHSDDDGYKKYKKIKSSESEITHGLIYYINDNYEGGEVFYPYQGISVKPKANMILSHPGSMSYSHAVKPAIGFDRFSIPSFMLNKKNQ